MKNDMPERERRMNAYYYGFEKTGVDAIDIILSAVACAGKAYHHTQDWCDDTEPYEPCHSGNSPKEWIQNAADKAAEGFKASSADLSEPKPTEDAATELEILKDGDLMMVKPSSTSLPVIDDGLFTAIRALLYQVKPICRGIRDGGGYTLNPQALNDAIEDIERAIRRVPSKVIDDGLLAEAVEYVKQSLVSADDLLWVHINNIITHALKTREEVVEVNAEKWNQIWGQAERNILHDYQTNKKRPSDMKNEIGLAIMKLYPNGIKIVDGGA